jgi:hypothetical protein
MLTALAEPIDRRRARLPAIVRAIRAVAPPLGIHVRDHLGRTPADPQEPSRLWMLSTN